MTHADPTNAVHVTARGTRRRSSGTAMLCAAGALVAVLGACAGETSVPIDEPAAFGADEVVLGVFAGTVDTSTGQLDLVPMGASDVGGASAALSALPGLDAGSYGSSPDAGAPAGTVDAVELKQLSAVTQTAWNVTDCGPTPTSGVCAQIRLRNLFPNKQLIRTYVELTSLTSTDGDVYTTLSNTTSDSQLGVSTALGLWRYGRVSRAAISGDSAVVWWPFLSTGAAPARFSFIAVVKGLPVTPIVRASLRNATTDAPPPTYGAGIVGNQASGNGGALTTATSISSEGRYVAFQSTATNLVAGATTAISRIYRRDQETSTTTVVSLDAAGAMPAGCQAAYPAMSNDGNRIAFRTNCALVPADTDALFDIYLRDVNAATTTLVSVDSSGNKANADSFAPGVSGGGQYIVFETAATNLVDQFSGIANGMRQIWRFDVGAGTTMRISHPSLSTAYGNGHSYNGSISFNGGLVAFDSAATNFAAGDANGARDVFLHDVSVDTTTRVSVSTSGGEARGGDSIVPALSTDGTTIAFQSSSRTIMGTLVSGTPSQVYVRSVASAASLKRVSVAQDGITYGNGTSVYPQISSDGRLVAFFSNATNLTTTPGPTTSVFLYDTGTSDTIMRGPVRLNLRETGVALTGTARPLPVGPFGIADDYVAFPSTESYVGTGSSPLIWVAPTN